MKTPVTVNLGDRAATLGVLRKAVGHRHFPDGWRAAEYAMTKAAAAELLGALERAPAGSAEATLDLFDWSLLQGELGRYFLDTGDQAAVALYQAIQECIRASPEGARRLDRQDEYEAACREVARLKARIETLEREMRQEQLDAATVRRLAGFPCGGCRQPTCGHCAYELGLEMPAEETDAN